MILTVIQKVFTGPAGGALENSFPDLTYRWSGLHFAPVLLSDADALGLDAAACCLSTVNSTVMHLACGVEILMLAYTIYLSFAGALILVVDAKSGRGAGFARVFALLVAVAGLAVAVIRICFRQVLRAGRAVADCLTPIGCRRWVFTTRWPPMVSAACWCC